MSQDALQRTGAGHGGPAPRPGDEVALVAYVKPVEDEGETVYAWFDGEGHWLGLAPTRGLAMLAARQQGLRPVDAH